MILACVLEFLRSSKLSPQHKMRFFLLNYLLSNKLLEMDYTTCSISSNVLENKQSNRKNRVVSLIY